MNQIGMLRKLVIVLTFSTIIKSQIDTIEQPQCIIEGLTSVICRSYEDFDIREEFELISSTHPNDDKLFDQLIIYYLTVHELPNNTFSDLKFTQISIHETFNLTSIHTNAFQSTTDVTEHLYLIGTKVLVNNPPDYDLYAAISSITNLKTVTITLNKDLKHEIPENAFRQINGPQSNLEVIAFRGDFVISRINNNAFSAITNLRRTILFSYIQIESISSGAFDFAQTSTDRLELHMNGCGLNESSLEDNVFSGSQRPLLVNLDSNQIRYIRQNTFSSFFNANPNNILSLANNTLDCDNTQEIQWLLDQRDQLQSRVLNAMCSDGTYIWNIGFDYQCDATTNTDEVVCSVNGSLALKSEFKRIAEANPTQTYYNRLYIENYPLFTTIRDDVFMGLGFGDIFIDSSPNLMNIHRNAFASTANTTHIFWLPTITQLRNTPPEYDVYYALSSLVNATFILIAFDPSLSHLIPENAFRNVNGVQTSLYEVIFEGSFNISRIGNNAFYEIPSLEFIVFSVGRITTVSSRAFDFSTSSETTLRINIHYSQLTHQSLEDNVFSGSQRPLIVDLAFNQINYVEENTFSAFLAADSRNQLIIGGNSLNCSDIERFRWLLGQKDQLESRVTDAMCSDGTNLWDLELPTESPVSETSGLSTIPPIGRTLTTVTQITFTTVTSPQFVSTTAAIPVTTTTSTSSSSITTSISTITSNTQFGTSSDIPSLTPTTQNSINPSTIPSHVSLCNEDYSYNGQYYILKWPPVRHGQTSYGECQTGYVGIAMWFCQTNSQFDTNGPQISCTQSWIDDLYDDIIDRNITMIEEVIRYISLLDEELEDNDITYYVELVKIVEMMVKLQFYSHIFIDSNHYLKEAEIISTKAIDIYSILLSRAKPWIEANQFEKNVISQKIVLHVQYASFLLGCQLNTTETESITRNNIYVENFKLNETGYTLESSRTNSTIIIPSIVDIIESNLTNFCPQRTAFAVIYERIDEYFNMNLSDSETIASNIIGFSFTNDTKTYTLNNGLKAKIILEHSNRLDFGDKIRCAFWDFSTSQWLSDGCERIANESNRDITTCECNHLTNFAAIIDISGRETSGGLKSTLTIICSSMSCLGLIMTIIMILLSKSNKRKKEKIAELRDTVTCNLCFCLIIVNLLVLFGMDQTNTKWLCQTLSALLLYSLLKKTKNYIMY